QHNPFSVLHGEQTAVLVTSRDGGILAEAERIELIDPRVVARFRAAVFFGAFDGWAGHFIQRKALRTMLAGCVRTVEWCFAFPPVEAREVTAGKRRPDDAVAGDIQSPR